jgi:hypothetical protein
MALESYDVRRALESVLACYSTALDATHSRIEATCNTIAAERASEGKTSYLPTHSSSAPITCAIRRDLVDITALPALCVAPDAAAEEQWQSYQLDLDIPLQVVLVHPTYGSPSESDLLAWEYARALAWCLRQYGQQGAQDARLWHVRVLREDIDLRLREQGRQAAVIYAEVKYRTAGGH